MFLYYNGYFFYFGEIFINIVDFGNNIENVLIG